MSTTVHFHNPTNQTAWMFLGNDHGAKPVDVILEPGQSATVELTAPQNKNFREVEMEFKALGVRVS